MNRKIIPLIVSLFALFLLGSTNPGTQDHQQAVKAKVNAILKVKLRKVKAQGKLGSVGAELATLAGGFAVDQIAESAVSRTSYLLFSTTEFSGVEGKKTIGVGILGNVFLSSRIDDVLDADTSRK